MKQVEVITIPIKLAEVGGAGAVFGEAEYTLTITCDARKPETARCTGTVRARAGTEEGRKSLMDTLNAMQLGAFLADRALRNFQTALLEDPDSKTSGEVFDADMKRLMAEKPEEKPEGGSR